MKKVLIIGITLFCLILAGADNAKAISIAVLVEQLQMKLAEDQIDYPDSVLRNLIALSYSVVIPHGLAYKKIKTVYASSGQSRIVLDSEGAALFVSSVRIGTRAAIRSLSEIGLKDLARRHIKTSVSSPQYFVFYRDIEGGEDFSYIYLYPTPTQVETLSVVYYMGATPGDASPDINIAYTEIVIDFALFFAYIRKGDWPSVAQIYNKASQQLTTLRELFVNRKPDIIIAPKEIE